jgi:hypothetical protein
MNNRILNKICYFLPNPGELLSCCKNFSIKRVRNIRWKNRIYFKNTSIKLIEYKKFFPNIYRKNIPCTKYTYYKNGKKHNDIINPKTGHTLPLLIT